MVGGDTGAAITNAGGQAATATGQIQAGDAMGTINTLGAGAGQAVGGTIGDSIAAGAQTVTNVS